MFDSKHLRSGKKEERKQFRLQLSFSLVSAQIKDKGRGTRVRKRERERVPVQPWRRNRQRVRLRQSPRENSFIGKPGRVNRLVFLHQLRGGKRERLGGREPNEIRSKMLRWKRLSSTAPEILSCRIFFTVEDRPFSLIPSHQPSQRTSNRFLNFYQIGNKAAIEKERARLADEMNRGYFADISEMKQHGGKIAAANKIIIPAMAAVKFPGLEVNFPDGTALKLPITSDGHDVDASESSVPKATLLCLSFRASSQAMVDSWSVPFGEAFNNLEKVLLYEVSLIDSWLLSRNPIKWLLLRVMRKSKPDGRQDILQRQIAYSFGDNYYFRKELKILNLLTGYIFLLDSFGRIRWQGFGLAKQEELSSLLSCTNLLLEEK